MKNNKRYGMALNKLSLLILLVVVFLGGCSKSQDSVGSSEAKSLVIPVSEISDQATFYPVTVSGVQMEVIAVSAPDGTIRTALNTCQVCYDSGRGYYVQDGDVLVCQNCGNRFAMSDVEVKTGGCNPVPIFAESKTVTDESISISYAYLESAKELFTEWKTR